MYEKVLIITVGGSELLWRTVLHRNIRLEVIEIEKVDRIG